MADADRCVMCGEIIPEGSHICIRCGKSDDKPLVLYAVKHRAKCWTRCSEWWKSDKSDKFLVIYHI